MNVDVTSGYAPPVINAIVHIDGSAVSGSGAISTDGNVTLLLLGSGFGPSTTSPTGHLVQYLRVQTGIQELPVPSFTVLNHSTVAFVAPPGIGVAQRVSVMVLGQTSTSASTSAASFDYLPPRVTALSPSAVPANPLGQSMLVVGHNFGLSAAGGAVAVRIGNPADGTETGLLPAQAVFPPGDNGKPKVGAAHAVCPSLLLPLNVLHTDSSRVVSISLWVFR